jgi:hypothetical protein
LGRDIRSRNESLLPAFFDRIKAEQGRLQTIQGGYNPGYTAQMSKLSRDQAQSAQKSQLEREIALGEKSAQAAAAQAAFDMQKQGMLASLARSQAGAASASNAQNFSQQMGVLNAMGGLRGQTPGEVAMYLQGGLGGLGAGQNAAGQFAQYNPAQVPAWQKALGLAGSVAGGLFGGGFNPFGGGGQSGQGQYQGGWS